MFPRLSRKSSKSSIGIKSWYTSKLSKNDNNIFNFIIPEDVKIKQNIQHNIINHKRFNTFFETKILGKEAQLLDDNDGDIITIHPYTEIDANDLKYLKKLKEIYYETYLSNLSNTNYKNKKNQSYPDFQKDLFEKSNIIYENFESNTHINTRIDYQTDSEFLITLQERIKGLQKCIDNPNETEDRKIFYKKQFDIESLKFHTLNENKENTDIYRIKEQCKSIYWNKFTSDIKLSTFDFGKFKLLLQEDDNLELKILKTFLPKYIINDDIDILISNIQKMLTEDPTNRTFKQYIFGFGTDIKDKYFPYRPFLFEIQSMMAAQDYKQICDKFVNWNIMLNLLFNTCSITNTDILFPCRFVLPMHNYTLLDKKDNTKGIKLRFIKKQYDLFDQTKTKFIGIITIKNIKNQHKRLMILFIFKNLDPNHFDRFDTIKGIIPEYFTVNERLRFYNEGSVISHPNITHTELNHFMYLSNSEPTPKLRIFRSNLSKNMIFFANSNYKNQDTNHNLDSELDLDFYKDLQLFEIEINKKYDSYKNDENENTEYFEFIPKQIKLSGGHKDNHNNNNIKLQTTTIENNLYKANPFISGHNYNNFINKVDKTIHMYFTDNNYNKKYTLSTKYLYTYLLISNNEINVYQDKFNIKDKILTITKYIPITNKFFYVGEILNKFNIFNINNKNILLFSYDLNYIEYIQYNNYKINNITTIVPVNNTILYKDELLKYINYINIVKNIYDIQIIEYNDNLYTLPKIYIEKIKQKYNIVIYTLYQFEFNTNLFIYENYLNIPNLFIGALVGLKYTEIGGTFILNFGSVAYKQLADIYIILSQYFTEHYLYYPEISNLFKKTGTQGIFKGYKGISDTEYNKLLLILNNIEKIYPNGSSDFNIYDPEIRKQFNITKPINPELAKKYKHIIGFLDTKPNDTIYDNIRQFNDERYLKQDIYMTKLLNCLNKPLNELESIKTPTQEQIINAILYCKKYDIPMFNKYSLTLQLFYMICMDYMNLYYINSKHPFKLILLIKLVLILNLNLYQEIKLKVLFLKQFI